MDLSKTDIDRIIKVLPPAEAADLIAMFDELDERKRVSHAQTDFLAFIGTSYGQVPDDFYLFSGLVPR